MHSKLYLNFSCYTFRFDLYFSVTVWLDVWILEFCGDFWRGQDYDEEWTVYRVTVAAEKIKSGKWIRKLSGESIRHLTSIKKKHLRDFLDSGNPISVYWTYTVHKVINSEIVLMFYPKYEDKCISYSVKKLSITLRKNRVISMIWFITIMTVDWLHYQDLMSTFSSSVKLQSWSSLWG